MKASPRALIAAALLCVSATALAQEQGETSAGYVDPGYNQIMATVEGFMDGLNARDAESMQALVIDGAQVTVAREGAEAQSMAMGEVIQSLASMPFAFEERIFDAYPVRGNGPVAMVWAPFNFYREGELVHCGVNVFTLVEHTAQWRIASITYSHVTDGCTEPANQ